MSEFVHVRTFDDQIPEKTIILDSGDIDQEKLKLLISDKRAGYAFPSDHYLIYWQCHLNLVRIIRRPLVSCFDQQQQASSILIKLGSQYVCTEPKAISSGADSVRLILPTTSQFVIVNLSPVDFEGETNDIVLIEHRTHIKRTTKMSVSNDGLNLRVCLVDLESDRVEMVYLDLEEKTSEFLMDTESLISSIGYLNKIDNMISCTMLSDGCVVTVVSDNNQVFLAILGPDLKVQVERAPCEIFGSILDVQEQNGIIHVISGESEAFCWHRIEKQSGRRIGRMEIEGISLNQIVQPTLCGSSILIVDRSEVDSDHLVEINEKGELYPSTPAPFDLVFDSINSVLMLERVLVNRALSLCCRINLQEAEYIPITSIEQIVQESDATENFIEIGRRFYADQTRILSIVPLTESVILVIRESSVGISIRKNSIHFPRNITSTQFKASCIRNAQKLTHVCSNYETNSFLDDEDPNNLAEQLERFVRNELDKWSFLQSTAIPIELMSECSLSVMDEAALALVTTDLAIDVELEQRSTLESESHVFRVRMLELMKLIMGRKAKQDFMFKDFLQQLYSADCPDISLTTIAASLLNRNAGFRQMSRQLIKALAGQSFAHLLFRYGYFQVLLDHYLIDEFWTEHNQCLSNLLSAIISAANFGNDERAINSALNSTVLDECVVVQTILGTFESSSHTPGLRDFHLRLLSALPYLPNCGPCSSFVQSCLKVLEKFSVSEQKQIDWHMVVRSIITEDNDSIHDALALLEDLEVPYARLKVFKSIFERLMSDRRFDAIIVIARNDSYDHPNFLDVIKMAEVCYMDTDFQVCLMFTEVFIDLGMHEKAITILARFISEALSVQSCREDDSVKLERDILLKVHSIMEEKDIERIMIKTDSRLADGTGVSSNLSAHQLMDRVLMLDCVLELCAKHECPVGHFRTSETIVNAFVDFSDFNRAISLCIALKIPLTDCVIGALVADGADGSEALRVYFTEEPDQQYRKQILPTTLDHFLANGLAPPDWLVECALDYSPSFVLENCMKYGFIKDAVDIAMYFLSKPTKDVKRTAPLLPVKMISIIAQELENTGNRALAVQLENALVDYNRKLNHVVY